MLQVAQSAFIPPIFSSVPSLGRSSSQAQADLHPNFQTRELHETQKPHDTPVPHLMCPVCSLGMFWGLILPTLAASTPQGCSGCEAQLQHSINNNISEITSKQSQTGSSWQQAGRTYRCRRHPETHTSNGERAYNAD